MLSFNSHTMEVSPKDPQKVNVGGIKMYEKHLRRMEIQFGRARLVQRPWELFQHAVSIIPQDSDHGSSSCSSPIQQPYRDTEDLAVDFISTTDQDEDSVSNPGQYFKRGSVGQDAESVPSPIQSYLASIPNEDDHLNNITSMPDTLSTDHTEDLSQNPYSDQQAGSGGNIKIDTLSVSYSFFGRDFHVRNYQDPADGFSPQLLSPICEESASSTPVWSPDSEGYCSLWKSGLSSATSVVSSGYNSAIAASSDSLLGDMVSGDVDSVLAGKDLNQAMLADSVSTLFGVSSSEEVAPLKKKDIVIDSIQSAVSQRTNTGQTVTESSVVFDHTNVQTMSSVLKVPVKVMNTALWDKNCDNNQQVNVNSIASDHIDGLNEDTVKKSMSDSEISASTDSELADTLESEQNDFDPHVNPDLKAFICSEQNHLSGLGHTSSSPDFADQLIITIDSKPKNQDNTVKTNTDFRHEDVVQELGCAENMGLSISAGINIVIGDVNSTEEEQLPDPCLEGKNSVDNKFDISQHFSLRQFVDGKSLTETDHHCSPISKNDAFPHHFSHTGFTDGEFASNTNSFHHCPVDAHSAPSDRHICSTDTSLADTDHSLVELNSGMQTHDAKNSDSSSFTVKEDMVSKKETAEKEMSEFQTALKSTANENQIAVKDMSEFQTAVKDTANENQITVKDMSEFQTVVKGTVSEDHIALKDTVNKDQTAVIGLIDACLTSELIPKFHAGLCLSESRESRQPNLVDSEFSSFGQQNDHGAKDVEFLNTASADFSSVLHLNNYHQSEEGSCSEVVQKLGSETGSQNLLLDSVLTPIGSSPQPDNDPYLIECPHQFDSIVLPSQPYRISTPIVFPSQPMAHARQLEDTRSIEPDGRCQTNNRQSSSSKSSYKSGIGVDCPQTSSNNCLINPVSIEQVHENPATSTITAVTASDTSANISSSTVRNGNLNHVIDECSMFLQLVNSCQDHGKFICHDFGQNTEAVRLTNGSDCQDLPARHDNKDVKYSVDQCKDLSTQQDHLNSLCNTSLRLNVKPDIKANHLNSLCNTSLRLNVQPDIKANHLNSLCNTSLRLNVQPDIKADDAQVDNQPVMKQLFDLHFNKSYVNSNKHLAKEQFPTRVYSKRMFRPPKIMSRVAADRSLPSLLPSVQSLVAKFSQPTSPGSTCVASRSLRTAPSPSVSVQPSLPSVFQPQTDQTLTLLTCQTQPVDISAHDRPQVTYCSTSSIILSPFLPLAKPLSVQNASTDPQLAARSHLTIPCVGNSELALLQHANGHSSPQPATAKDDEEELRKDGRTVYKTREDKSVNEVRSEGQPPQQLLQDTGFSSSGHLRDEYTSSSFSTTEHGSHDPNIAREQREKEDFHFSELSSTRNQFEQPRAQPTPAPRKPIDIRAEVSASEGGVYESQPTTFQPEYDEEVEEGVYENQPVQRSDVVKESDRNIGQELPSIGTARNLRDRWQKGQVKKASVNVKQEFTPPEQVSSGVFENQPQYNPDVVHSGQEAEDHLPGQGTARNMAAKFKELEKQGVVPSPAHRELTPDRTGKIEYVSEPRGYVEKYEGRAESGVFESQPSERADVVRSEELQEEILPQKGFAKNVAQHFKQMSSENTSTATRGKREITPDTSGRVEFVSEPRGFVETYQGRAESGVFESQPAERADVVKSDELPEEILPQRGYTRNVAAIFKEMEKNVKSPPMSPGRHKEFTPPRENGVSQHSGVFESNPQFAADVVHSDEQVTDILPEQGTARNLVNRFKQLGSPDNSASHTPRGKKEFTPPPADSGVYENNPKQFIPEYNRPAESGIIENNPQIREDVVRGDALPNYEQELPERGTARSLVSAWRQRESGSSKTPVSGGKPKEFTPPREEPRVAQQRAQPRTPKSPAAGGAMDEGSVHPMDLPGQYQPQLDPTVFESQPAQRDDVVREDLDKDWREDMPQRDTTKKMLAKFRNIQTDAATKEASQPMPSGRRDSDRDGSISSGSSPDKAQNVRR